LLNRRIAPTSAGGGGHPEGESHSIVGRRLNRSLSIDPKSIPAPCIGRNGAPVGIEAKTGVRGISRTVSRRALDTNRQSKHAVVLIEHGTGAKVIRVQRGHRVARTADIPGRLLPHGGENCTEGQNGGTGSAEETSGVHKMPKESSAVARGKFPPGHFLDELVRRGVRRKVRACQAQSGAKDVPQPGLRILDRSRAILQVPRADPVIKYRCVANERGERRSRCVIRVRGDCPRIRPDERRSGVRRVPREEGRGRELKDVLDCRREERRGRRLERERGTRGDNRVRSR